MRGEHDVHAARYDTAGAERSHGVGEGRLRGLDGLRGLAVIAVLLFHQGFGWASGGYLGVSLFFTLSGFLIARLLLDEVERTGGLKLGDFWRRRIRRLAPAAVLAMFGICVYGAWFATESQLISLRADAWAAIANVANWRFISSGSSYANLFRDPSPVQHFWSLAIEEQFYLVFPLVVAGAAVFLARRGRASQSIRRSLGTVIVALMGASLAMQLLLHSTDREYYGTDTRAFELLAGVLLACCWTPAVTRRIGRAAGVAGAALLAVMFGLWSSVGFGSAWLYGGGFALVALTSVVVIASATVAGPVRALGSFRPLVAVGLVSYGLYLYHWPVFLALDPVRTGMHGWALFALRMAVVTGLAVASYFLVELPFRRGAFGRVRVAPVMWVSSIAAAALVVGFVIPIAHPDRVISASTFDHARSLVQQSGASTSTMATPATADGSQPLKVYVVGDSTGVVFAGGIALYGSQTGKVEVRSGAMEQCPLAAADKFRWYFAYQGSTGLMDVPVNPECANAEARWKSDLENWRPDMIVVVSGPTDVAPFHLRGGDEATWLHASDPAGARAISAGAMRAVISLQRIAPGVPELLFTSPYLWRAIDEDAAVRDPNGPQVRAFTDAYNLVLDNVATTMALVATVSWADAFNALPTSVDEQLRPDGVHATPESIAKLLVDWFPRIDAARGAAAAEVPALMSAAG